MTIVTLLNCYLAKGIILFKTKTSKLTDLIVQSFRGFTIIELLIVMSLLGIATTLVSSAYLSYEKRERVKKAVLDLESDLRLAQNKALAGDKGIAGSGVECTGAQTLVGWFIMVDTSSLPAGSYEISLACQNSSGGEDHHVFKSVSLPKDTFITDFSMFLVGSWGSVPSNGIYKILFQPLERNIYVFDNYASDFFDASGNYNRWQGIISPTGFERFKLRVEGFSTTYEVEFSREGEFNVKKI